MDDGRQRGRVLDRDRQRKRALGDDGRCPFSLSLHRRPYIGTVFRGILERWHWLFGDSPFHKSVLEWDGEFAEIWALCDSVPNHEKNRRSKFGGLWGRPGAIDLPPGEAKVRVVCREKSALASNIEGTHTTLTDYRADEEANFSFRLVSKLKGDFPLAITWPFNDLRKKKK